MQEGKHVELDRKQIPLHEQRMMTEQVRDAGRAGGCVC